MIQQAGGTIEARREPEGGTTFEVRLPRARFPPRSSRRRASERDRPATATVLVVEDEPMVRRVIERSLEQEGYRILSAPSGDAALSTLAAYPGPIELLLTDVVMPRMSGAEVAQRVLSLRPGVRVLFMSGFTDAILDEHGVRGSVTLLRKPFGPNELTAAVRVALS